MASKVSELSALAAGDVTQADDLLYIVDVSAGTSGGKKITVSDLLTDRTFTGTLTWAGSTGANIIAVPDNLADAFSVKQGANAYLTVVTTNSSEQVQIKKPLTLTDAATLAAAGSVQGDAGAIANQITFVSGADGTKGVVLPAASAGLIRLVYNLEATNGLKVYPASGDDINDGTADAAVTIEGKTLAVFVALDSATWAAIYTANT